MGKDSEISWTHHENWGNEVLRRDGYILVRCPQYPFASQNGYVLKHRLVMAAALERPLSSDEHVHHINGDKQDNRLENLEVLTNSEHRKLHESQIPNEVKQHKADHLVKFAKSRIKPRQIVPCECGCGQEITTPDKKGRPKRFVAGHATKGRTWRWQRG